MSDIPKDFETVARPCWVCGNSDSLVLVEPTFGYFVACKECGNQGGYRPTKNGAIGVWNTIYILSRPSGKEDENARDEAC